MYYIALIKFCIRLSVVADTLGHIWFCYECQQCFVFKSDKEDHTKATGHENFREYLTADLLGTTDNDIHFTKMNGDGLHDR